MNDEAKSHVEKLAEGRRGTRLVPFASQPVCDQTDRVGVEDFFAAEGRHAVVALAVETVVRWIADKADEPVARTVACKIGAGRVFSVLMKFVALGATHRFA